MAMSEKKVKPVGPYSRSRRTFAVKDLPLGALVEIEVIAEKTH